MYANISFDHIGFTEDDILLSGWIIRIMEELNYSTYLTTLLANIHTYFQRKRDKLCEMQKSHFFVRRRRLRVNNM